MYKISEVSKKLDISVSKIRYLDRKGLLPPNINRDSNNNRIFNDDDIGWIDDVICFQNVGMKLENIKQLIHSLNKEDYVNVIDILKKRHEVVIKELSDLEKHKKRIEYKINMYKEK